MVPVPAAGGEPAHKKVKDGKQSKRRELGGPASSDAGLKELLDLLTKQTLANTLRTRDLGSILLQVWILPANLPEILAMQEQGSIYASKTKGKAHELGPPHVYIEMGLVQALAKRPPNLASGEGNLATLNELAKFMTKQNWEEVHDVIPYCRESKVKAKMRRLEFHIVRDEARVAINMALKALGGDHKHGLAPMGAMERELQMWLNK